MFSYLQPELSRAGVLPSTDALHVEVIDKWRWDLNKSPPLWPDPENVLNDYLIVDRVVVLREEQINMKSAQSAGNERNERKRNKNQGGSLKQ